MSGTWEGQTIEQWCQQAKLTHSPQHPPTPTTREEGTNKHTLHHLGQLHNSMEIERRLRDSNLMVVATKDMGFTHKDTQQSCLRGALLHYKPLHPNNLPDLHETKIKPGVNIKTNKIWCCMYQPRVSYTPLQKESPEIHCKNDKDKQFRLALSYWGLTRLKKQPGVCYRHAVFNRGSS